MNRTRCPWCGKLIDKKADSAEYRKKYFYLHMKISFGRHYGICSHCGKIYNDVPRSALICLIAWFAYFGILMIFPIAMYSAIIVLPLLVIISSKASHFKRIEENLSGIAKYEDKLKFKSHILAQYYEIRPTELLLLSKDHDAHEPFSRVSPIFITKCDEKSGVIEGYWIYDHFDNAYFASLDQVHLYDDDGNVVADVKFQS